MGLRAGLGQNLWWSLSTCNSSVFAPDGPDAPIISPSEQNFVVGFSVTLSCEANSNPPATYTWLTSGVVKVENASVLQLSDLTFNDSRIYTCRAFNNKTGSAHLANKKISVWGKYFFRVQTGISAWFSPLLRHIAPTCPVHSFGEAPHSSFLLDYHFSFSVHLLNFGWVCVMHTTSVCCLRAACPHLASICSLFHKFQ